MVIETLNNETLIRIPKIMDFRVVQSVVEYLQIVEMLMQNQGTEEDAMQLAQEIDANWWTNNRKRFIK